MTRNTLIGRCLLAAVLTLGLGATARAQDNKTAAGTPESYATIGFAHKRRR